MFSSQQASVLPKTVTKVLQGGLSHEPKARTAAKSHRNPVIRVLMMTHKVWRRHACGERFVRGIAL